MAELDEPQEPQGAPDAHEVQELRCRCGKPVARFDRTGVRLYCRHSKQETLIPYATAAGYEQMLEFARQQRPAGGRPRQPEEG